MPKLVHKGSTKDVYEKEGNYLFRFSDRYSVFDWGEMPDHLEGKGRSLAQFTKSLYQKLQEAGIKHHIQNVSCSDNEMVVRPFTVVRDGSSLSGKENVFIPLEVIFRLGFARGSSLKKKMKTEKDWLDAGYPRAYQELEMFEVPQIEFTTKLERFDRPLTEKEAKDLSGLNEVEWVHLLTTTKKVALILKEVFAASDVILWDGKIELAAGESHGGNRDIVLVDSIGPDELRLTKNSTLLSKEIIRQFYRKTPWYQNLDQVKEKHGENFKEYISAPPVLPAEFKKAVEDMYQLLPLFIQNPQKANLEFQKLQDVLRRYQ